MSGGVELAGTPERMRVLQLRARVAPCAGHATPSSSRPDRGRRAGADHRPDRLEGALFDPHEGNLDPNGATYAYAEAAKARGAEVIQHDRVLDLDAPAERRVAPRHREGADHRRARGERRPACGRAGSAGWSASTTRSSPMVHHYLVTDDVPEVAAIEGDMPAVTDLEGFTYLQREGNGVLLGVYERNPRHWRRRRRRLGLRPRALPRGARPDHAGALDRVRAVPRAPGDRHQAVGERRVHLHARREPARRSGRRPARLLGRVRLHGRLLAGRRRSAWRSRTGSPTATRATTCSGWTSRGSAPYAANDDYLARHDRRSSTRAGS